MGLRNTGKRPSVLAICNEICQRGGVSLCRGGDRQAIDNACANDKSAKRPGTRRNEAFIVDSILDPNTLRSRYVEVNRLTIGVDQICNSSASLAF